MTEDQDAPGSLEAAFRDHGSRVFRVAYRVTGNASDAEDVVQTIFLRLLRREGDFQLGATAGSYLHRAAVNAGLDLLRARQRAAAVPLDQVGRDEPGLPELSTGPAQEQMARIRALEMSAALREALSHVNPRTAEIFVLRYVEGFGNTEIADMLGVSRNSIGVSLHRCRERLKEELRVVLGLEDSVSKNSDSSSE